MSSPTFDEIMAYERKKAAIALGKACPEKAVEAEPDAEKAAPDYNDMSRSDLFKLAKSSGYDKPWIASTVDTLVEFLSAS